MRTRLALVTGFFFVSLAAAIGCGSDDGGSSNDQQQPVPAPGKDGKDGKDGTNGGNGNPGTPGASNNNTTPTPPGGTASSNGGTPPAGTGTPPAGTGTPPVTPPGGSSGAIPEAKCSASSLKESEGNDNPDAANVITLDSAQTFCGSLTAADSDHFAFTLPADAKEFGYKSSWSGTGTPKISIIVEGVTYGANDKMPFKPGQKYVFKIAEAAAPVDYVIALGVKR